MIQPWRLGPPAMDFSAIGNLGKTYQAAADSAQKRALEDQKRMVLANLGQTGDYTKTGQALIGLGEIQEGAALIGLGQKAEDRKLELEAYRNSPFSGAGTSTSAAPASGGKPMLLGNPSEIETQFIDTVKGAGLTNPIGLAAVAATGRAESGYSPQNVNRSWNDPSQSGQPGTAGGIMSWRAERLQNLYRFAAQNGEQPGAISPRTQALFLAQEDPQLIPRLNAARSAEEANQVMADAWRYAGFDKQGGENARRLALTKQYASRYGQAAPVATTPAAIPVQVAETEADVRRLEAQQGNPVIDPPVPVQVAQAPGSVSDADIPRGSPVEFTIPGSQLPPNDPYPRVTNEQLIGVIRNPRSSAGDKAIAQQLFAARQAYSSENAPDKRAAVKLQNEKTEVEIARGRRDLEGKGFRTLTAEERAAAGVDPSYKGVVQVDRDGQLHFPGKASSEVNIKNEGAIPAGYRAIRDQAGNVERYELIPGSEAARDAEDAAKKAGLRKDQSQITGNVVINALNDIDMLMKDATLPTTGAIGSRLAGLAGTSAHDISQALTTIGANISFQTLQQMRDASPTGGALGAVSDSEQKMLQNAWGALSQSQTEAQFKSNLGRVRAIFERVVHGRTLTPEERSSGGPPGGKSSVDTTKPGEFRFNPATGKMEPA